MFRIFGNQKNIHVQFFQIGEKQPFAESKMPIDQLPDTFEIDTTLTIKNEQWRVSHAEPISKSEFRRTGRLHVFLTKDKPVKIGAEKIRFTIPSISNDIAGVVPASTLENVFVVHEDDWRQIEVVSNKFRSEINEELGAIAAIVEEAAGGLGYNNVHVRKRISSPLMDVNVPLALLESQFGIVKRFSGVAFRSVAAVIERGFAHTTSSGVVLWGQLTEKGDISVLCVQRQHQGLNHHDWTSLMDRFLEENNLLLVDWNRMSVVDGRQVQVGGNPC